MKTETLKLGGGIYTVSEVAAILRLPVRKVAYWVNTYLKDRFKDLQGFQYHTEVNERTVVNFHSLIEIYTFFKLKEGGVPKAKIIRAHELLAARYGTPYPFAHASMLKSGGEVLFSESQDIIRADSTLQLYLFDVIIPFCEKISFGTHNLADAYYPLGTDKKVVVSPHHQFGQPTITGTNILVSTVQELHVAGDSKRLIKSLYHLTEKQVDDAILYFRRAA